MNSLTQQISASELVDAEVELINTEKELHGYNEAFTQGKWDGSTGMVEPDPYSWINSPEYRQGFQVGQAEYFDQKFGGVAA